jgi:hypothetical protein
MIRTNGVACHRWSPQCVMQFFSLAHMSKAGGVASARKQSMNASHAHQRQSMKRRDEEVRERRDGLCEACVNHS